MRSYATPSPKKDANSAIAWACTTSHPWLELHYMLKQCGLAAAVLPQKTRLECSTNALVATATHISMHDMPWSHSRVTQVSASVNPLIDSDSDKHPTVYCRISCSSAPGGMRFMRACMP